MVKLSDVAAQAGVSAAAVSRVLSGDSTVRVSDETRDRILSAARELRYVPNHAARALRTARSSAIALVVPEVTSAVFAELARGTEEGASARGLTVVLARAEQLDHDHDWLERLVAEGRVNGVILQVPEAVPFEVGTSAPTVLINSQDDGPVSTVVLDDAAGIRTAVEHLQALGHQRVGYIGGLATSATGARREAGFLAAVADFGLQTRGEWMTRLGYSGDDGRAAVAALLALGTLPSALVVANLNAALGVLAGIHASGLRVPDDISLVALHDVWYADATWPPITTVRMPLAELGRAAVELLVDPDPEARPTHRTVTSPAPKLIVRASTAKVTRSDD